MRERELRARGRRTLTKLLDAGREVFATRGYYAARVDDIVAVAKTSHGTFYLYFANKEDLFRALAQNVSEEMVELANALGPIAADDDGFVALRDWLQHFGDLYERHYPILRAWTAGEVENPEFAALGGEVLGTFTRNLVARIRDADPPDLDPEVAGLALTAMIERFNYFVVRSGMAAHPADRAEMIDNLATIIHVGLFGGARQPRKLSLGR